MSSTPRVILFTGKGGVGKTTTAAATAVDAAGRGHKTLLVSTDPAHSIADVFGRPVAAAPTELAPSLYAAQVDGVAEFAQAWGTVRDFLAGVLAGSGSPGGLSSGGLSTVHAAELLTPPGAAEVCALVAVRQLVASGAYDVVILDCAPSGETLRLLALPAALGWLLDRARSPAGRVLGGLSRASRLSTSVIEALQDLRAELTAVERMLRADTATVRLVATPERMVVAETRRLYTSLVLLGYRVDAVVANRMAPRPSARQASAYRELRESFGDLPSIEAPAQDDEPLGVVALGRLRDSWTLTAPPGVAPAGAGLVPAADPALLQLPDAAPPAVDIVATPSDGGRPGIELRLALPLAVASDVEVARVGNDIVVTVGTARRIIALPAAAQPMTLRGAQLAGGTLIICLG